MRKLLVTALIAVMVLSMASTAFAAGTATRVAFSDISGHDGEWALTVLGALGVYSGEQGLGNAVKPDDPITRAQFSKVVVEAFGKGRIALGMAGIRPAFADEVPAWAWGYVNCAVIMGIINGYDDGTFGANKPVSYAEAVTMVVRAVAGHDAVAKAYVAGWPFNYIFHAMDYEFIGDVDLAFPNLPATRADVARLLLNAMRVNQLDKNGLPKSPAEKQLADARIVTGTLSNYDLATNSVTIGGALPLAGTVYLAGATSLESLMNLAVVAVKDSADKICAIGKNVAATTYSGVFTGLTTIDSVTYLVFADGTKIPYTGNVLVRLNGDLGKTQADLSAGDECVVTRDGSGAATYIVALSFRNADYLDGVTPSTPTTNTILNRHTDGAIEVLPTAAVTINGSPASRDSLAQWDVVYVAENAAGKAVAVRAIRRVVEGTVTATWETYPGPVKYVTIGGVTYVSNLTLNVGTYYKLALDKDGKIFVSITVDPTTPFVFVKSYTEYSDGRAVATFDVAGTAVTYPIENHAALRTAIKTAADNGYYGWLKVTGVSAEVTDFAAIVPTDVQATLTTALTGDNNDLTFTAKVYPRRHGNNITVEYKNLGANQTLSIAVTDSAITVNLATDGTGAITSTATGIKAAIEAHAGASALVSVSVATGNNGSGVVTAMTATNLSGGAGDFDAPWNILANAGGAITLQKDGVTEFYGLSAPVAIYKGGVYYVRSSVGSGTGYTLRPMTAVFQSVKGVSVPTKQLFLYGTP
ncbi:MAG: S-layer homology domain-containing protein [Bacillota bacterium]